MTATTQALTGTEATTLDDLEQVIEKGLATFIEVGQALQHIRDGKLYRESYTTFEEYAKERWGLSRAHAYRQIEAAEVIGVLQTNGNGPKVSTRLGDVRPQFGDIPASESVARELASIKHDPEKLRETWGNIIELHGPKPTAEQVRQVVDRRQEAAPTPPAPTTDDELTDDESFLKEEIPGEISRATAALTSEDALWCHVDQLVGWIDEASKLGLDLSFVDVSDLQRARQALDEALDMIIDAVKGGGS